ncbi:MAG: hypothetical protein EOM20_06190 [Spartobacteria bacterium]|nr:hypothetical protein [Spartobacteria bacterium]
MNTDFIWLVHPLNESQFAEFGERTQRSAEEVRSGGPAVVDVIEDRASGMTGHAISTPLLPLELVRKKNVIRQLELIRDLIDRTFEGDFPIGLGAWWASVSRHGALAREIFGERVLIDGYHYTVMGIYHELLKHLSQADGPAKICIIGAGTVGSRLSDVLSRETLDHTLFDIAHTGTCNASGKYVRHVRELDLHEFTIGVCCTSATRDVVTPEQIPEGFICIDDSYPHVIPEYEGRVDGGIWRNEHITSQWIVQDGQVYGCLMELIDEARRERGYAVTEWKD